jgi:hypothetical protein
VWRVGIAYVLYYSGLVVVVCVRDIKILYCEFCASRSMMAAVTKVCSIPFWHVYSVNVSNLIFFKYDTF